MGAAAANTLPLGRHPPAQLVPGGLSRPEDIPGDIFEAALATFLDLRRLDMQALAAGLGIGRATLYRRVAGRDHLLGEVIWYLTRRAMTRALEGTERLAGDERVISVVERFIRDVHDQPALRRLLDAEPEAALRILTSRHGPIQPGVVEAVERLLAEEEALGALQLGIDRGTLAYVIVRMAESFLYADVIADNEPDVGLAVEVISRLLCDWQSSDSRDGAG